jgi:peptidoglycan/xylan/chitin deacetylase (PgdA/CDA1 family)
MRYFMDISKYINTKNKVTSKITVKIDMRIILYSALFLFAFSLLTQNSFAAEETGDISLLLTYDTGSKASFTDMSLKVYKDLEKVPLKEILLQSNPVDITGLSLNHKYKIEVYFKDLYQGVGYYELKQVKNDFTIPINSPGGVKFGVFFSDLGTPIKNVDVIVKTMNGNFVSQDKTDLNGDTIIFWIPQTLHDQYYDVDVVIDPSITFSYKKLRVTSFEQHEIKIVTPWPKIIDSVIPIEVYHDEKNKVSKSDGSFTIQVNDKKKNKITESAVSSRGDATITNIPVGTYAFHVVSNEGKILASKKVTLSGSIQPVKIFLNDPQLNTDSLYCNCVAFRFDDVQDYFLNNAQLEVLKLTGDMDVGITIGVIGGAIGNDQKITNAIKEQMASNPRFEIASHSYNHQLNLPLSEEENSVNKTDHKIQEIFNVKPKVFIPPENYFNRDTTPLLKKYGYTHLSSSIAVEIPPKFVNSDFYHFDVAAYTGTLDPSTNRWIPIPPDVIMEQINDSLFDYGYAVVMMHPNDFSNFENGAYVNVVNQAKIDELKSLITEIKSNGYILTPIGKIDKFKTEKFQNTVPIVIDDRNKPIDKNCNCIAFKIDNVQDFWINDVQNEMIDTFSKNNVPVSISVIGKFFGTDPKAVDFLKQKIKDHDNISVAIRGWEYVDHSSYGLEEQSASIKQTNQQLSDILGVKSNTFSVPFGKFNEDTITAMHENNISYLSGISSTDKPDFKSKPFHIPETSSLTSLLEDDPFYKGTIIDKFSAKIQVQQNQYKYALVSMQPSDFAMRDNGGEIINQVNKERIQQLKELIGYLKEQNIQIVSISDLPQEASFEKYPVWIKRIYDWNAQKLITDTDLDNAIKNLVSRKIIVPF